MTKQYTFYLCSDNNTKTSTDKARLKKIGKALREMGHKTKWVGVGPSSQWKAKGCTSDTDVLLFVVSGLDVGILEEWGGTLGTYWKKKFKNAHPFMIKTMSGTERRTVGDKKTVKWGYCKGGTSTGLYQTVHKVSTETYGTTLKNPAKYCRKHGITFLEGGGSGGISDIVSRLKKWDVDGSGIDINGSSSSSSSSSSSTTVTKGYNTSTPFQAYLRVGYVVQYSNGKKSDVKNIYIDWSEEAPDVANKWSNSEEGKDISLNWVNNHHSKCEIELLSKIQSVEKKYDEKARKEDNNKYIIKYIDFMSYTAKADDKSTTDTDESLLYDSKTDQSTRKMLLYSLGFYSGDVINNTTLGVSGKTLLDSIKTVLDEANYLHYMQYGVHREADSINFKIKQEKGLDDIDKLEEFNEFINGNILGISNITFSPVSNMVNSNMVVYKKVSKDENKTSAYYHTKTANLSNILRYGELNKMTKSDVVSSYAEAKQKSYDEYLDNFNTQATYTATVVGLPTTPLNDYVESVTIDERLCGAYQLCSKTIKMDVEARPMIRTDCGLGAIDTEIAIYKNLEKQRKELIKNKTDINEPISFEDDTNLIGEL